MFSALGNIITVPFAALLRWLYALTGSYGISIILFGLVVKLVVLPFQMKSKRSMVRMGRLSSKQQELQKQYAKNQQKYQEELQKLYQEEGINPMGGCLWSFLPLFILIPLYSVIRLPITHFMGLSQEVCDALRETAMTLGYTPSMAGSNYGAYEQLGLSQFISQHWENFQGSYDGLINVNYSFLGLDLSKIPSEIIKEGFSFSWAFIGVMLIPIISAALSYVMSVVTMASNGQKAQANMKAMNLMMPLMSLYIGFVMPAGLGIYWIANSVFAMVQEAILGKFYTKKITAEEEERAAKRDAARQLRMEEAKKRAAELKELEGKKPKKQPQKSPEKKVSTNEAGRVGDRPYARGRSYKEDRYDTKE